MEYTERDVIAEMTTAFEQYEESEGHTYDVEPGERDDSAIVTVTAPDGTTSRFVVYVRAL